MVVGRFGSRASCLLKRDIRTRWSIGTGQAWFSSTSRAQYALPRLAEALLETGLNLAPQMKQLNWIQDKQHLPIPKNDETSSMPHVKSGRLLQGTELQTFCSEPSGLAGDIFGDYGDFESSGELHHIPKEDKQIEDLDGNPRELIVEENGSGLVPRGQMQREKVKRRARLASDCFSMSVLLAEDCIDVVYTYFRNYYGRYSLRRVCSTYM